MSLVRDILGLAPKELRADVQPPNAEVELAVQNALAKMGYALARKEKYDAERTLMLFRKK